MVNGMTTIPGGGESNKKLLFAACSGVKWRLLSPLPASLKVLDTIKRVISRASLQKLSASSRVSRGLLITKRRASITLTHFGRQQVPKSFSCESFMSRFRGNKRKRQNGTKWIFNAKPELMNHCAGRWKLFRCQIVPDKRGNWLKWNLAD